MKKVFFLFACLFFSINVSAIDLDLNSKNAYIYNLTFDKEMYDLNGHTEIKTASMTKIMTAIIIIENSDLSKLVTIDNSDYKDSQEYAVLGLKIGDSVTVEDLLYGILLYSGSDCVNAAVRATTNTEEMFVDLMNKKALELGLENTHFSNPVGKDENNYSTLSDLAKIMKYCLKNETFKKIITTDKYDIGDIHIDGPLTYLSSDIKGAKTGYTYGALYSLVSFSEKDNVSYIVVTNYADSYKTLFEDNNKIYQYLYQNYGYIDYMVKFNLPIKKGKDKYYEVNEILNFYIDKNYNKDLLQYKYDGINEISKDIKKGSLLGNISIYYDNDLLTTKDIYLTKNIKYKTPISILIIFICSIVTLIILFIILIKNIFYNKIIKSY